MDMTQVNAVLSKAQRRFREGGFLIFAFRLAFFLFRHGLQFYDRIGMLRAKITVGGARPVLDINGCRMRLDLSDQGLSRDLFRAGIREPKHTELLGWYLKAGQTVLDVGANIGYYALPEARAVGATGVVYALEPVPENFARLQDNIALNGLTNIRAFQLAASARTGEAKMQVPERRNWAKVVNGLDSGPAVDRITVATVTLDDFLADKRFPDIIRMDVEGYETEIWKGMSGIIGSGRPLVIFIELHCFMLSDAGLGLLEAAVARGFRIAHFFRDRSSLMLDKPAWLRRIYNALGRRINGVYEFHETDPGLDSIRDRLNMLKEEVFFFVLERP